MTQVYQLKKDPYSSHSQIAQSLIEIAQHQEEKMVCTVLDVGCSQGFIGSLLSVEHFSFIGIDNHPAALEKLPPIYAVRIEADIESPDTFERLGSSPDVLVFGDVLEHTRSPEDILKKAIAILKPGGFVIISVPNVANLVIRLNILLGRFDYTEQGILDRTHLRFFTMKSARQLCIRGGMDIKEVKVTPVPLPVLHPWFSMNGPLYFLYVLIAGITRIMKNLLAYQIICVGKKI